MAKQTVVLNNSVGGELSPLMYGRADTPAYQKGLLRCENFTVYPQGAASFRNGSTFVNYTHLNGKGVFIPFQFSDSQSYLIVFTNLIATFYKSDGKAILNTLSAISAITQANPGVITTSAVHGLSVGQEIFITSPNGMTELNNQYFYVNTAPTTSTLTIKDVFGNVISTSALSAYAAGGTLGRVLKIATPYAEAILEDLKYAQTGDTMFISHDTVQTNKLIRSSETSWAFSVTGGGFGQLNANQVGVIPPTLDTTTLPRAVCFSQDGRLVYGGTTGNPERVWGSKTPDKVSGATQYEVFTVTASNTPDTDAFVFTLANINNKLDIIQWILATPKYLVIGCSGSVRRMFGANEGESPSPNRINSKVVNAFGADRAIPVVFGADFFYIERGSKRVRNLTYDYQIDTYDTTDMNLVADHICPQAEQLCLINGKPDVLWVRRLDGKMAGLTHKSRENIAGWHRHYLGGSHVDVNSVTQPFGKILNLGQMARPTDAEQLWFIVERMVNGNTIRTIEYLNDPPAYPVAVDFYTDENSKVADETRYINAAFETQKTSNHLDCSLTYNGTITGISITLSATTVGTGRTITASAAIFTAAMATSGREVWVKYDSTGNGGGRARITGFTSATVVTVEITEAFASTTAASTRWMITAGTITGLRHLEGQTVGCILDGAAEANLVVSSGAVTLPRQASYAIIGLRYKGIIQTLNLDFGGETGSAQASPRTIEKWFVRFLNSINALLGPDPYKLTRLKVPTKVLAGRGPGLFSGLQKGRFPDGLIEGEKFFCVRQDLPLPCTVTGLDFTGIANDE